MKTLYDLQDLILVAFGAVFGANTRYIIYRKLDKLNLNKNYIILLINTFSSFCIGFFSSILSNNSAVIYSYQFVLFFSIGLLGSLSTFSTFIYDLYELFIKFKFFKALNLFIISMTLGILALAIGFVLGMP